MTHYKWLRAGRKPTHADASAWRKGRWRSVKGEIVPCENGLHLCRPGDLAHWISEELWVAEIDPASEIVDAGDKIVVRRARIVERLDGWNETTARLFAANCAERVLPIFERDRPGDDRPRLAIEAARRFARGEIGRQELAAARDATRAAAWDAAGAAARDAARAATWDAARAATWDAARDAARAATRAATRDAAGDAAGDAEREWQSGRILDYAHGRAS